MQNDFCMFIPCAIKTCLNKKSTVQFNFPTFQMDSFFWTWMNGNYSNIKFGSSKLTLGWDDGGSVDAELNVPLRWSISTSLNPNIFSKSHTSIVWVPTGLPMGTNFQAVEPNPTPNKICCELIQWDPSSLIACKNWYLFHLEIKHWFTDSHPSHPDKPEFGTNGGAWVPRFTSGPGPLGV